MNLALERTFTIGQVARSAGIGVETVRFYERRGLLQEPPRRSSGYRSYPADAIKRLRFVRRAKDLGFSLDEIKDLMALRFRPGASCSAVKRVAAAKVSDVEAKVKVLQRIRRVLLDLVDACLDAGPLDACPILKALEDDADADATKTRTGQSRDRSARSAGAGRMPP
jgi:Hg(II)-responsive transcriptional regulator